MISIVINNYNYARFLSEAINSALSQTVAEKEVIVVDDGSSDNSQEIIATFGDRILPIFKTNGGQASAINAGFEHARGEWVAFLDADDYLEPQALELVLQRVQGDGAPHQVANVQFFLRKVDAQGNSIQPAATMPVKFGREDPLERLLQQGAYKFAPTSGNLYRRSALERFLPMPEAVWRICADAYLQTCIPFHGKVIFLETVLGGYRVHGANLHCQDDSEVTIEAKAQSLYYRWNKALVLREQAEKNGLRVNSLAEYINYPPTFWEWVCRRLYRGSRYTFPKERRIAVLSRMVRTFGNRRAKFGMLRKLRFLVLTVVAMFAPTGIVQKVAQQVGRVRIEN
jgi:glycosyltransferase involved in cell wall biosynthesis